MTQFRICFTLLFAATFALVLNSVRLAEAKGSDDAADPAKVDADYAIQGEYGGTLTGGETLGVQVIAMGGGQFNAVAYAGGLPGDGWDKKTRNRYNGKTEGDVTKFTASDKTLSITGDKLSVTDSGGKELGTLKKVARSSPTLGAKPPAGAVVLFDGTTTDHFVSASRRRKTPEMTADGLLKHGVNSKQTFGSHTIHIEFRLPYQPKARGQGRGNSGLYIQGRYEVQMLDSFGLEGKDDECGGVYKIARPLENMCFPPLVWQTYDINFTAAQYDAAGKKTKNAHMAVRHNGVVIHQDLELPHATAASPNREGPADGFVHLQDHGNPVRYRNIWVVPE